MAQSGYTPILLYASGTATNVPLAANLTSTASGAELALNYADGKLYFKNSSGVVTLLASSGTSGITITDDTTTNATRYLTFTSATSGSITGENTSSTKLQFNPSTGAFTSTSLTPTNALGIAYGGTNSTATATAGGVGYGTGTAHAYSAAGTAGQVLTSAGTGTPTWSTPSAGAMTLISTQTASNSDLIWTGLSGYSSYLLIFSNCTAQNSGNPLYLNIGYGSTTYVTSGYQYEVNSSTTGAVSTQRYTNSGTIQFSLAQTGGGSQPYQGGSGYMYITGCNNGYPAMNWMVASSDGTNYYTENGSCQLTSTYAVTALKFTSYTHIGSGTASLYGISS